MQRGWVARCQDFEIMRIRSSLPDTFYEEGFTDQTDPFQHKDLAERLTHLFQNLEHGTVSILDGRWGSGKTVFAKQWVTHLKSNGTPAIYFDAFAVDYIDNPFQAVSSAFIKAAGDARQKDSPIYKRFLDNAAKAGKSIGSTAAKIGTKVITLGIIGSAEMDQLSAIKDELSASVGEFSEEAVKKMLETQADSEATFNELKKSLSELPELLAPADQDGDEKLATRKSLVVIIDELDRCRPDFALGVLESLKHFFRADGVHFVLVTNTDHLRLSVQKRYGVGDAAQEYLQKFYDFIVHFESRNADHRGPNSAILAQRVLADILPSQFDPNERRELGDVLAKIATSFDLTLRQVENIATNVALAYLAVRDREFRPRVMICFLALLKALRPQMYQKVKMKRFNFEEFSLFLVTGSWPDGFNVDHVLNLFQYHGDPDVDPSDPKFDGFGSGIIQFQFGSRLDVLPYLANAVMDRFGKV